jgi:DNA repair ATPase RecN
MEAMDVFKKPILFSEEFINIKIKNSNNRLLDKISFFSIIDSFYLENKGQVINITLNNISGDYAKLRQYFKQFYEKENFEKKEKERQEKRN